MPVGRDHRPGRHLGGKDPFGRVLGEASPTGQLQEAVAMVVHAGEYAHELVGYTPRMHVGRSLPRFSRQLERAVPGMVPAEGLMQVILIDLGRTGSIGSEGVEVARHHLADAMTHEEGGLEADMAGLRRLAQGTSVDHASGEGRPGLMSKLRGREYPVGLA